MLTHFPVTGKKATRDGFGDGLLIAGQQHPNVVALCADLVGSLKMNAFIKEFPERFVQTGVAEANMIGIAAGLATAGKFHIQERLQISLQDVCMIRYVNRWHILIKM